MFSTSTISAFRTSFWAILLGVFVSSQASLGALVGIEYYDRANVNPEFAGGPLWTGFVDTTSNTVTIETWKELPLHGSEYWVPRNLPLVWSAYDSAGKAYDVPDTFDGTIDETWGFVSDETLRKMNWFDTTFVPGDPPTIDLVEAEFTLDTGEVWPGWGAFALQRNLNGTIEKVFETANPSTQQGQPEFDENIMPALPVSATAWVASTEATVTATLGDVNAVPEAKQWIAISMILAGLAMAKYFRERRSICLADNS